jgi:hypothetical protein
MAAEEGWEGELCGHKNSEQRRDKDCDQRGVAMPSNEVVIDARQL